MKIGIPRVLNIYENYPFWQMLFAECGFEVVISPESNTELYQKGISSVMSDNICFPAKLVHGHIMWLIEAGVDRIFYPIVQKESNEWQDSNNSYNCPIVSGYPEVIRSSIDPKNNYGIPLDKPVISFNNVDMLRKKLYGYLKNFGIKKKLFDLAYNNACRHNIELRERLISAQKEILERCLSSGELVFVVSGRPYHSDILVNQKVGQIIADLGITALTDDVFSSMHKEERKKKTQTFRFIPKENKGFDALSIISQWSYPNRVLNSAIEVSKLPHNVQLIQLNSFGCGPDSFYIEQIGEILNRAGKNHTIIRIDEMVSTGSIRLRIRSLIESLKNKKHI